MLIWTFQSIQISASWNCGGTSQEPRPECPMLWFLMNFSVKTRWTTDILPNISFFQTWRKVMLCARRGAFFVKRRLVSQLVNLFKQSKECLTLAHSFKNVFFFTKCIAYVEPIHQADGTPEKFHQLCWIQMKCTPSLCIVAQELGTSSIANREIVM